MEYYDVLGECGKRSGISARAASLALGHNEGYIATQKTMGRKPSVDNAARVLDAYGYALCAVPHSDVTDSMLRITPNRED